MLSDVAATTVTLLSPGRPGGPVASVTQTFGPMGGRALLEAAGLYLGFVAALFVLSKLLPGRWMQGGRTPDGERLSYKLNGLPIFLITVAVALGGQLAGWWSLAGLKERFGALFIVANVFAFALTGVLLALGWRYRSEETRAIGNPIGRFLHAAWFGVEQNPAWWGVDLKLFSYRPSLIGLALMNLSFAVAQYELHGMLSAPMLLYQAFTFIYVFNYFQFEYGMIFTWDIIAERFGWMLVWGDYVFVPFFYCLCGWFLYDRMETMPPWSIVALAVLFVFGFWLFRGSNEQKHRFKTDPNTRIWGRPAEALGGRILVSGFWGIGRHLNYTGEILIYTSFALTTGFDDPWPYILPAWLAGLLLHRAWRDDQRCSQKYGELWDEYTRRARFRMVPFLY